MTIRWFLAVVHLLALGIGLSSVWQRGRALRSLPDHAAFKRLFRCDTAWGVAALLWIVTGALRAFGGFEKGTDYYMADPMFGVKMALLGLILLLEIWPMVTLIRWRILRGRAEAVNIAHADAMAWISYVQALLVVGMVFAAAAIARGIRL